MVDRHLRCGLHMLLDDALLRQHSRNVNNFLLGHGDRHLDNLLNVLLDDALLWGDVGNLDDFLLHHWHCRVQDLIDLDMVVKMLVDHCGHLHGLLHDLRHDLGCSCSSSPTLNLDRRGANRRRRKYLWLHCARGHLWGFCRA